MSLSDTSDPTREIKQKLFFAANSSGIDQIDSQRRTRVESLTPGNKVHPKVMAKQAKSIAKMLRFSQSVGKASEGRSVINLFMSTRSPPLCADGTCINTVRSQGTIQRSWTKTN